MAEKLCFGHPKETVRGFIRRILPDKCGIRLVEAVESSEVIEALNDPDVIAVIADDSMLTEAHVDILRGASKPVVVITDNTAMWTGVKTIPKKYTIEQMLEAIKAEVSVEAVETKPAPQVAQAPAVKEEEKVQQEPQPIPQPTPSVETQVQPVPQPTPQPTSQPVAPTAQPVTVSSQDVQRIVGEEIRYIIREILWEILPLQAEKILREEIRNILKERLAK